MANSDQKTPVKLPVLIPAATLDTDGSTPIGPGETMPLGSIAETTMPPSGNPSTPRRIGRFELLEELGEGAFGIVYRAHDPQLDREVALKLAKPGALSTPRLSERFLREAKSAAQLRHPNIVPVFDAGRDGEHYYIASAFIRGRSLEAAVRLRRECGEVDFRQVTQVVRHLAEALGYAHSLGIVHRDVKPANVMLDEKDQPHLMDFGLAARQEEQEKLTQEGAIIGTPLYMAPEQARGKQSEPLPASDQYSLGVLFYELLTGETPFAGPSQVVLFNHLTIDPPRPHTKYKGIPRDLETICLKCLEKEPSQRYADCQALAEDLERFQSGQSIRAKHTSGFEAFTRWLRRRSKRDYALYSTVFALVVAIGVTLSLWYSTQQELAEAKREAREFKLFFDQSSEQQKADLSAYIRFLKENPKLVEQGREACVAAFLKQYTPLSTIFGDPSKIPNLASGAAVEQTAGLTPNVMGD